VRVDDEVFTAFVRAQTPALARTAYLLAGDPDAAEDLLQAAFAATYVHWGRLRHLDDAALYVRRQLTSTMTLWRRRRSSTEVLMAEPAIDETADDAGEREQRDELVRALRQLSTRQRAVIVLRFYDDLTEAQVAEVLGCSVGSVKTHAHRGLERLRELLDAASSSEASAQPGAPTVPVVAPC
jgi:RNA polymerase sigma-70 factor (sigma-E family)